MKQFSSIIITLFVMATTLSAQSLTDKQKHLATIAALEAQGDLVRLEPAILAALNGGVTINEVKEAFSQLYAYTGFPRSLNALGVLNKVLESGNPTGLKENLGHVRLFGITLKRLLLSAPKYRPNSLVVPSTMRFVHRTTTTLRPTSSATSLPATNSLPPTARLSPWQPSLP